MGLRQLGDIGCDPPRLVLKESLRREAIGRSMGQRGAAHIGEHREVSRIAAWREVARIVGCRDLIRSQD